MPHSSGALSKAPSSKQAMDMSEEEHSAHSLSVKREVKPLPLKGERRYVFMASSHLHTDIL